MKALKSEILTMIAFPFVVELLLIVQPVEPKMVRHIIENIIKNRRKEKLMSYSTNVSGYDDLIYLLQCLASWTQAPP